MSEPVTLEELTRKRNELQLQLKMGKLKNVRKLIKVKREIARRKTK